MAGGGETQVLDDGATPPLGSPASSGDTTRSEGGDEGEEGGVMYGETQALDDDEGETQAVDDEFEEEGEGLAVAGETQMVEDSEEDVAGQTLAVEVEEGEDSGGTTEDEAGDWARTQLVEECEVEGGGGGDRVEETQLVEECREEERVDDSGDDEEDAIDWGMTQLVEDSEEEVGDDGDDEGSDGTQVQSDDEGLQNDERDVKEHDGTDDLGDSDASTDEEGGAAPEASTMKSLEQGKRQAMAIGTFPPMEIVQNSTSCSTSLGDNPDCGIDDGSYGYVQSHDKDGSKSKGRCSTAKKLFADTAVEGSESRSRRFSGLSYLNSQEPGDLSQANALEVVEGLIFNGGLSSQEPTPKKLVKAKPPVSIKMGTLQLAEKVDRCRSSNGKPEIFAWVDSQEDDGGGDFFSKNKDILLHQPTGIRKSKVPRPKKCSTKIAPADIKTRGCKRRTDSNVRGKIETLPSSDSRLLKSEVKSKRSDSRLLKSEVKSKRISGKRSKKNLLRDLDGISNAKPVERQQEKVSVNLHDIGLDTQMAVEAIEALAQSSPAENLTAEDEPPVNRDLRVGSKVAKSQLKNGPPQNRTRSIQEGIITRSKRIKVTELNQKTQKEIHRGTQVQENSEDRATKTKHKQAKPVQQKNKVAKIVDGNKYASTPVAHRTRHTARNILSEYSELCSNKHLKKGINLTDDTSTIGEVRNNHIGKESAEHTCSNNAQNLQQNSDASIHHTGANVAQNLEPFRDEPTTHVSHTEPSSHPRQRRTPTAMLQAKAPAVTQTATDHEMQPEVARSSKKRRVFIRSSELLTYARKERSSCRSTSVMSSIIAQSSAVSPILNSSTRVTSKTSGFSSSDQRQKEQSGVKDASNSPRINSPVPNSPLKTPSKVVNKLSPTFSPLNPSKASNRSLSKPSVARELLELDPENTLTSRQRKDSRRKDMASASVLFSHHLDEDVIKRQKKILARLGVREAFSVSDATHFVADGFFRTKNMLEAIALGKLIVTSMWLESCGEAGCYVSDKKYILRDAKKEKEIGFSMPVSLVSACEHPLLLGKRVFVTQNVKPSRQVLTSLVSASSGQPLERIGRSISKEREAPDDLLVISCEEDYESCVTLLEKGASVFEAELLLNGIVTQKLEYERHRLFSDRVKQTRSTRWLKDDARGRFVPVSRT